MIDDKIIRLIKDSKTRMTTSEISRKLKISRITAIRILNKLYEKNILDFKYEGPSKVWKMSKQDFKILKKDDMWEEMENIFHNTKESIDMITGPLEENEEMLLRQNLLILKKNGVKERLILPKKNPKFSEFDSRIHRFSTKFFIVSDSKTLLCFGEDMDSIGFMDTSPDILGFKNLFDCIWDSIKRSATVLPPHYPV